MNPRNLIVKYGSHAAVAVTALGLGVGVGSQTNRPIMPAIKIPAEQLYPSVPFEKITSGQWGRPRAKITGNVTLVKSEEDGDIHFRVENGTEFIVCEITPPLPLPRPKVGQKVVVWGIVRYDGQHKHWEIHPTEGWQEFP